MDVLQYYFGGYVAVANDGHVGGAAFDSTGVDDPFAGLSWALMIPSSRATRSGCVVPRDQWHPSARPSSTSSFDLSSSASTAITGGASDPHTGMQYVFSQIADVSYSGSPARSPCRPLVGS